MNKAKTHPQARINRSAVRQLLAGSALISLLLVVAVSASSGAGISSRWYRLDLFADHPHIAATQSNVGGGPLHTCALTNSGGVRCWGYNGHGRLGDGTAVDRLTPVDVVGLTPQVQSIGGGWGHTCALMTWGGVRCWGNNGSGQIGDNSAQNRYTPVNVAGLYDGITQLSVGLWHSCVVTDGGGVKCWGAGENGRLGDGAEAVRRMPVDVVGLSSGVAAVAAGGAHTCALLHSGAVKCWGSNHLGTLGDGTTIHERLTPVDVVGLHQGAVAITAGDAHTCALMADGSIRCWGYNGHGELGDGTTIQRNAPVAVLDNGKTFVAVAASYGHTCAVTNERLVQCWGRNSSGQLGNDTTIDHYTPAYVIGLANDVAAIGVGYGRTCARLAGGALKCWGANGYGTIGDGTIIDRLLPTDVVGFRTSLLINYPNGRQGSTFTLNGSLFPPNETATITANGHVVGAVVTDAMGNLAFQLATHSADDGLYLVAAAVNPRATAHFLLDAAAPLRPPSGSGALLPLPAGIALTESAFLPVITR